MTEREECRTLSDGQLAERLGQLTGNERGALVCLLVHLAEFDSRKLYSDAGCPSLFVYCVSRLRYSEAEAYRRIYVARKSKKFPPVLDMIRGGQTHLEGIALIGPYLTTENHSDLLDRIRFKTRRKVEIIVAELAPQPDRKDYVRLPSPTPASAPIEMQPNPLNLPDSLTAPIGEHVILPIRSGAQPNQTTSIHPTSPGRVRFAFSGSEHLLALFRRAQEVLKHKFPVGAMESILEDALEALLEKKDPERRLRAKEERWAEGREHVARPQSVWAFANRRIPQAVKDTVWRRDGGQCVFLEPGGERCPERGGLEFDHIVPFALGGASNNPKNIRLLCKTHNMMLARRTFGSAALPHGHGSA